MFSLDLIIYPGFNPLSIISFANIFSYSVCYICILSMVFFLFFLIGCNLFNFAFIYLFFDLGDRSKIVLLQSFMSKYVLPIFSSNFLALGLTFRSLIHFEFIFAYGVRKCSNLIVLHGAVPFFQHHLLKRLFPILYSFLLCHRLINH